MPIIFRSLSLEIDKSATNHQTPWRKSAPHKRVIEKKWVPLKFQRHFKIKICSLEFSEAVKILFLTKISGISDSSTRSFYEPKIGLMRYFPRISNQSYFRKSNENEIDVLAFLVFQIANHFAAKQVRLVMEHWKFVVTILKVCKCIGASATNLKIKTSFSVCLNGEWKWNCRK